MGWHEAAPLGSDSTAVLAGGPTRGPDEVSFPAAPQLEQGGGRPPAQHARGRQAAAQPPPVAQVQQQQQREASLGWEQPAADSQHNSGCPQAPEAEAPPAAEASPAAEAAAAADEPASAADDGLHDGGLRQPPREPAAGERTRLRSAGQPGALQAQQQPSKKRHCQHAAAAERADADEVPARSTRQRDKRARHAGDGGGGGAALQQLSTEQQQQQQQQAAEVVKKAGLAATAQQPAAAELLEEAGATSTLLQHAEQAPAARASVTQQPAPAAAQQLEPKPPAARQQGQPEPPALQQQQQELAAGMRCAPGGDPLEAGPGGDAGVQPVASSERLQAEADASWQQQQQAQHGSHASVGLSSGATAPGRRRWDDRQRQQQPRQQAAGRQQQQQPQAGR